MGSWLCGNALDRAEQSVKLRGAGYHETQVELHVPEEGLVLGEERHELSQRRRDFVRVDAIRSTCVTRLASNLTVEQDAVFLVALLDLAKSDGSLIQSRSHSTHKLNFVTCHTTHVIVLSVASASPGLLRMVHALID